MTVVIPVPEDLITQLVAPDDGRADMPAEDRARRGEGHRIAQLPTAVLGQPVPQRADAKDSPSSGR